jgi:hypothetical protein
MKESERLMLATQPKSTLVKIAAAKSTAAAKEANKTFWNEAYSAAEEFGATIDPKKEPIPENVIVAAMTDVTETDNNAGNALNNARINGGICDKAFEDGLSVGVPISTIRVGIKAQGENLDMKEAKAMKIVNRSTAGNLSAKRPLAVLTQYKDLIDIAKATRQNTLDIQNQTLKIEEQGLEIERLKSAMFAMAATPTMGKELKINQAKALHDSGKSTREVSQLLKVPQSTVARWIK